MRILICSDGTDPADTPTRLGALVGGPCKAATTLLGIAERPGDEDALRRALENEAEILRRHGISPETVIRSGEPIRQILSVTSESQYDLAIIGARRKGDGGGLYWRPEKTYEVIKAIPPPVLVAIGPCKTVERLLVCTGGKRYSDAAVHLAGEIAVCVRGTVTLLHVMAEPPAIYADLVRLEEDVDRLLQSGSELGENLRGQKETLEKMGIPVALRIRHGLALDQIFSEVREGKHDLIVTGSSQARGTLRHYIMGNLTRSILNGANTPVLVARAGKLPEEKRHKSPNFFRRLFSSFGSEKKN